MTGLRLPAPAPRPAPPALPPLEPVAAGEVLGLRARWITRLPAPVTLVCGARNAHGDACRFIVTTSRPHYEAASRALCPVVTGDTWVCLTDAAARRATALALEQWLMPCTPLGLPPAFMFAGRLHDLLGMSAWAGRPAAELAADATVTVGAVLSHFAAHLIALDPAPEACVRLETRVF